MTGLASETLTFLFTDIEGSTKLWEAYPEAMETALARHDALMRQAIEANDGAIFKTVGDAFCAVFAETPAALAAAIACQQALASAAWPVTGPLRARMGLHAGEAEQRDNDYFGPTLNCVARLMSAGFGGQVLLSQTVLDLAGDRLPTGVGMRDLGEHRLRDLQRPVHVFQMEIPGLPSEFPPIKSLEGHPTNLPAQLTPLIGRANEIAAGVALLQQPETRLVTLTGPGGTGKTRLALQIGAELVDDFADGVFFVPLAPVRQPALAIPTIARTLGIRESRHLPLVDGLIAYLRDKQLLLVLDNFEQLVVAAPELVALLEAAPGLKTLVTSRAELRVSGEHEFPVAPLAAPERSATASVADVARSPAVDLFVQRARAARPSFALTEQNVADVATICARLDGLPLALELAAAKIQLLPPKALLARLDRGLSLLTAGARDLPERHQTMRAAIAWSFDLLSPSLQQLFCRLTIFAGDFTVDTADQVMQDRIWATLPVKADQPDTFDGLAALVSESLLRRIDTGNGEPRLTMLETVREFGLEQLNDRGELDTARQAHAAYFLDLAEQLEDELSGPDELTVLEQLEAERDNIRAALTWWEHRGDGARLLRLAAALGSYWDLRGRLSEGRDWLRRGLARAEEVEPAVVVKALHVAGLLAWTQGDFADAERHYQRALTLSRELGDQRAIAISLQGLGNVAFEVDDYERAKSLLEESLAAFEAFGDRRGIAMQRLILGEMAWCQSRYAVADEMLQASLALYRQLDDERGEGLALNQLALVALRQGDDARAAKLIDGSLAAFRAAGYQRGVALVLTTQADFALQRGDEAAVAEMLTESTRLFQTLGDQAGIATARATAGRAALLAGRFEEATAAFDDSLSLSRAAGDRRGVALALLGAGEVALQQGDARRAGAQGGESLSLFRRIGDRLGLAMALEMLAAVWTDLGEPERAARLHARAAAVRDEIGAPLPPVERDRREAALARVRSALGEERFAAAWDSGRVMTQDELALEVASEA